MGTVVKKDTLSIKDGESAKFTILFWNVENVSYKAVLDVKESPKDWTVVIQPREFILDSSTGEEYIKLPYMEKSVRALPINVFVKPENAEAGEYHVFVNVRAGLPGETLSFFQERQFDLTINLEGSGQKQETENRTSTSVDKEKTFTGESVLQISFNYIFYLVISVCILIISIVIYKYA